jgi:glycosyltransferase involved in cell wall biosynthesis
MRLGLVIYGSLETPTGGYLYDRLLVEHLRRAGHTLRIFSMAWGGYPRLVLENLNLRLVREIRRAELDALLEDELNHASLVGLNRLLRRTGRPILSIVHHLRSAEPGAWLPRSVARAVERRYLTGVDAFIYNSEATREAVQALTGQDVPGVVAHPGGDRLGAGVQSAAIRVRALAEGPLQVIYVGAVTPRKGLHRLIEAMAALPAGMARLRVVGDLTRSAGYARQVRGQAERLGLDARVKFLGRLTDDELAACLATGHVLAVPSTLEGFGIAYLEGMAFGLPCLAASHGGAGEVVQDGVSGFLIDKDNPQALASRLRFLASDRENLARMGLAARRRFEQQPAWEESLERIQQFILEVAQTSADERARLRLGPQPTYGGVS